ncbi:hypothetical protein ACFV24_25375 [Nocardia fluminea]|uniref:hypothetical protein n=1 Tax=Nocardia fluminea TaxID=134984 RepID=UPI0036713391
MADPDPGEPNDVPEWMRELGIHDRESAVELANAASRRVREASKATLRFRKDGFTLQHLILMGFVARAQGFAEATACAIAANNPYAAFTLLRSYFENAAAILYVTEKPDAAQKLWERGPNSHGIKIGTITNYARQRFPKSKELYNELSQFAHPHSISMTTSINSDASGKVSWRSEPAFETDEQLLLATAWLEELTTATGHLFREFADVHLPESENPITWDSVARKEGEKE